MNSVKAILILILVSASFVSTTQAAFRTTQKRYLAPRDFQLLLGQKFPVLKSKAHQGYLKRKCYKPEKNELKLMGSLDPGLEKPVYEAPSSNFVRYYSDCIQDLVTRQMEVFNEKTTEKTLARFFAPALIEALELGVKEPINWRLQGEKWLELDRDLRLKQVEHMVRYMIGPEPVIKDLTDGTSISEYSQNILSAAEKSLKEPSSKEALERIFLAIALKEEFLTY